MRKIDYLVLARVIRGEIKYYTGVGSVSSQAKIEQCQTIARKFADHAHVKKDEFLTECGIK